MTPKAAVIALLVAAEETKLDAPIVSHYRGVWWSRNSHKWQAAIQYGGVKEMLGTFPTEEEAAFLSAKLRVKTLLKDRPGACHDKERNVDFTERQTHIERSVHASPRTPP